MSRGTAMDASPFSQRERHFTSGRAFFRGTSLFLLAPKLYYLSCKGSPSLETREGPLGEFIGDTGGKGEKAGGEIRVFSRDDLSYQLRPNS
jgi:hypothetical protein